MINRISKRYLYSLRVRYAGIAILFATIILASASLAYLTLKTARNSTTDSIESRQELQQRTRHIRDGIWQTYESLQLFLFNPQKELYQSKIHNAIESALNSTDRLLEKNAGLSQEAQKKIHHLKELLNRYDNATIELINIRTTATVQYPSLAYARGSMLGLNREFVTAASLAIDEYLTESEQPVTKEIYYMLVQVRHHWVQIMSNFRMYLANRLGTFDNDVFEFQIRDIETQYKSLQTLLARLQEHNAKGELDFQAADSLQAMLDSSTAWYADYLKVKEINHSDEWRADARLVSTQVEPVMEQIWSSLLDIELEIERTTEMDVGLLTQIAEYHVNALWLAAGLAILFVITSYLLLDKTVLGPLSVLTGAIKAEAHGGEARTLPNVKTLETQNLLDAFIEMRKQIHSRQTALEHQALHDSLTGLANRTLLLDRTKQAMQQCIRNKSSLSLLIIDLDRFKEVNDTLGHQVGDRLLEAIGFRLKESLREIDTVARLGGDEFAILLPGDAEQEAREVAKKLQHLFEDAFTINDTQLYVSASIGIASYPAHGHDLQDLIKHADIAMYVAKRNKLGYAIYDSNLNHHSVDQLALGTELRTALDNGNISLVYQPKLDSHSQTITGLEALLRWKHPELGQISASDTIQLAEQTGFINQLTIWVIDEVSRQQKQWSQSGLKLPVAINLSVYNLQSKAVIEQILSRLDTEETGQNSFIFEITESAMMLDPQHALDTIRQIHQRGGKLSIDDFGTGFSSLTYLKEMPVDELKIDKSFVIDMLVSSSDAMIVRSIIDLAHNLGLKVVAEGVENKATLQILQKLKCDVVQGNYLCPPLSAEDLVNWHQDNYTHDKLLDTAT